jgi:hypothetical protein
LDIEDLEEYKAFAKEIKTVLPTKMTIFVDMAEIQKRWSRVCKFFCLTVSS